MMATPCRAQVLESLNPEARPLSDVHAHLSPELESYPGCVRDGGPTTEELGEERLLQERAQRAHQRKIGEDIARHLRSQLGFSSLAAGGLPLQKFLRRYDKDKSGSLCVEEIRRLVRVEHQILPAAVSDDDLDMFLEALAAALDVDGTGRLAIDRVATFLERPSISAPGPSEPGLAADCSSRRRSQSSPPRRSSVNSVPLPPASIASAAPPPLASSALGGSPSKRRVSLVAQQEATPQVQHTEAQQLRQPDSQQSQEQQSPEQWSTGFLRPPSQFLPGGLAAVEGFSVTCRAEVLEGATSSLGHLDVHLSPELYQAVLAAMRPPVAPQESEPAQVLPKRRLRKAELERKKAGEEAALHLRAALKAAMISGSLPKMFRKFDKDRSGSLTSDELRRLIRLELHVPTSKVTDSDIDAILFAIDCDATDTLSVDELAQYFGLDLGGLLDEDSKDGGPHKRNSIGPVAMGSIDTGSSGGSLGTRPAAAKQTTRARRPSTTPHLPTSAPVQTGGCGAEESFDRRGEPPRSAPAFSRKPKSQLGSGTDPFPLRQVQTLTPRRRPVYRDHETERAKQRVQTLTPRRRPVYKDLETEPAEQQAAHRQEPLSKEEVSRLIRGAVLRPIERKLPRPSPGSPGCWDFSRAGTAGASPRRGSLARLWPHRGAPAWGGPQGQGED